MGGAFLEGALETFAGYAAVEALSEGPYGVLAAVDNRQDQRVVYAVLDHEPNHGDSAAFLGRLNTALAERNWDLKGITTEGSARAPAPSRTVLGPVPHQLCPFHVIKELPQGVLKAVAKARERLAQSKPPLPRGRPSSQNKEARRWARTSNGLQGKIRDVFQARSGFVNRRRKTSAGKRLRSMTRGLPQLRKLREIMDAIYAWFDRRCRPPPALGKLPKLRQWVSRFTWRGDTVQKVFSPPLEKALTCLDDPLLPATSKAVERGNRRHRTRQKSVYRVRSKSC